jgi:hypothetical protein
LEREKTYGIGEQNDPNRGDSAPKNKRDSSASGGAVVIAAEQVFSNLNKAKTRVVRVGLVK